MQTSNGLLLIRCFTKYIIEIENECALLEQINSCPSFLIDPNNPSLGKRVENTENQVGWNEVSDIETTPAASPQHSPLKKTTTLKRDDSQDLIESENDSVTHVQFKTQESKTLFQLINSLFELCISIPVG